MQAETALSQEYKRFKIFKKQQMNHNVVLFRIEFEKPDQILGLPVGQHVYLRSVPSALGWPWFRSQPAPTRRLTANPHFVFSLFLTQLLRG